MAAYGGYLSRVQNKENKRKLAARHYHFAKIKIWILKKESGQIFSTKIPQSCLLKNCTEILRAFCRFCII